MFPAAAQSVAMKSSRAVEFFGSQFERQIEAGDFLLNPFEILALPHMRGSMLDLGCGLGNLSAAAARQGAAVSAIDACANAIASLEARAREAGLPIEATRADLRGWTPGRTYDAVACIGLLMFFERAAALSGLAAVRDAVAPGGVAVVNVLTRGTTYMAMFDPAGYHLFSREELLRPFAGWRQQLHAHDFPAPGGTLKRFLTLVARSTAPGSSPP